MSLKMFEFSVRNTRTGETAEFLGQGETLAAAWKDGFENVCAPFRPKNDGKHRDPQGCAVTLPNGETITRQVKDFEGDVPASIAREASAA